MFAFLRVKVSIAITPIMSKTTIVHPTIVNINMNRCCWVFFIVVGSSVVIGGSIVVVVGSVVIGGSIGVVGGSVVIGCSIVVVGGSVVIGGSIGVVGGCVVVVMGTVVVVLGSANKYLFI